MSKQQYVEADIIEHAGTPDETVSYLRVPVEKEQQPQRVRKESQQQVDQIKGFDHVSPRYSFSSLLNFMDINVWHGRSVRLKANLVAGLGWSLTTGSEDKNEDEDYEKIMAFLEDPNEHPEQTFDEIAVRTLIDHYAIGNGFIETSRSLDGEPAQIYPVRGNTIRRRRPIREGGYVQILNGRKKAEFNNYKLDDRDTERNDMLHFFQYDPLDDFYGIPEFIPAIADMVQDRAYVEYTLNLFRNQMLAKFLIVIEGGKLSNSSKKTVTKFLKNHTSVKNAGGTIVLSSDDPGVKIRIEKIDHSFEAKEGSSGKGSIRNFSRDIVIAAHAIPPRLLGIMTASQLGGGGENQGQLNIFKETVIDPDQSSFEAFLNRTLLRAFGEHKWQLKFNEFDTSTPSEDAEFFEKATGGAAWMDTDEVREAQGLPVQDEVAQIRNMAGDLGQIRKKLQKALYSDNRQQDI